MFLVTTFLTPREVRPEYPVGNGESVDFAIVDGSDFRILVLCESIQHSLSSMRRDQLVRAIHALGADYGILGNGEFFECLPKVSQFSTLTWLNHRPT